MPVVEKRDVFAGVLVGALVGLPVSAVIAGTISWYSLARHQQELVSELTHTMAVIAVEPIPAGSEVKATQLAQRAVLKLNVTPNTLTPADSQQIAGRLPKIGFLPGDILVRSAFDLPPREEPPAPTP